MPDCVPGERFDARPRAALLCQPPAQPVVPVLVGLEQLPGRRHSSCRENRSIGREPDRGGVPSREGAAPDDRRGSRGARSRRESAPSQPGSGSRPVIGHELHDGGVALVTDRGHQGNHGRPSGRMTRHRLRPRFEIADATANSLKHQRSSNEPPPRVRTIASTPSPPHPGVPVESPPRSGRRRLPLHGHRDNTSAPLQRRRTVSSTSRRATRHVGDHEHPAREPRKRSVRRDRTIPGPAVRPSNARIAGADRPAPPPQTRHDEGQPASAGGISGRPSASTFIPISESRVSRRLSLGIEERAGSFEPRDPSG